MTINEFISHTRCLNKLQSTTPIEKMYKDVIWFIQDYFNDFFESKIDFPILEVVNSSQISTQLVQFKNQYYLVFDEKLSEYIRVSYFSIVYGNFTFLSEDTIKYCALLLNNSGHHGVALELSLLQENFISKRFDIKLIEMVLSMQDKFIHKKK